MKYVRRNFLVPVPSFESFDITTVTSSLLSPRVGFILYSMPVSVAWQVALSTNARALLKLHHSRLITARKCRAMRCFPFSETGEIKSVNSVHGPRISQPISNEVFQSVVVVVQ